VFSVGATPASVFQTTDSDDHVMVYAVPSSTISVRDCPAAQVPAVGVEAPESVQVWIVPLSGESAGVVPETANTVSV
jgi:hypothetical protein